MDQSALGRLLLIYLLIYYIPYFSNLHLEHIKKNTEVTGSKA